MKKVSDPNFSGFGSDHNTRIHNPAKSADGKLLAWSKLQNEKQNGIRDVFYAHTREDLLFNIYTSITNLLVWIYDPKWFILKRSSFIT